jgi:CHAT domain-containing protein
MAFNFKSKKTRTNRVRARFKQWRSLGLLVAIIIGMVSPLPLLAQVFVPGQSDVTNPNTQEIVVPQPDQGQFERINIAAQQTFDRALTGMEEYFSSQVAQYYGFNLYGETASPGQVADRLAELSQKTGQRSSVIYTFAEPDGLHLLMVLPGSGEAVSQSLIRKVVAEAKPDLLQEAAREFRSQVSDPRKTDTTTYLASAQKLYQWIVAPIETELQANKIDTLVFCMDDGLRALPLAALHDGQQFLIQKYNVSLIPSFSLTDTQYAPLQANARMLGVGISESTGGQAPLPAVAVEVPTLTQTIRQGQSVLNQDSTLENLQKLTSSKQFSILHLATHAEFRRGDAKQSFIQLWDSKLTLNQLGTIARDAQWSPTLDLLVLSACQTALGDRSAELGFVGLAVRSGVETALGSLWRVSDAGSLGLMAGFYEQLNLKPTRISALRQAQLAMLQGEIRVENNQLYISNQKQVPIPADLAKGNLKLSHPYYWSAFQLVGNWN